MQDVSQSSPRLFFSDILRCSQGQAQPKVLHICQRVSTMCFPNPRAVHHCIELCFTQRMRSVLCMHIHGKRVNHHRSGQGQDMPISFLEDESSRCTTPASWPSRAITFSPSCREKSLRRSSCCLSPSSSSPSLMVLVGLSIEAA